MYDRQFLGFHCWRTRLCLPGISRVLAGCHGQGLRGFSDGGRPLASRRLDGMFRHAQGHGCVGLGTSWV